MAMVELDQMKFELQSYENTLHEVKDSLDLEGKKKRIEELEMEMEAPGFWDDPDSSNRKMKELKNLKDTAELCNKLETQYSDIETLIEMGHEEEDPDMVEEIRGELDEFIEELDELRISTLLSGEYDKDNAILKLNAGAGGTESCDWCGMLYRMYTRWAEKKGFFRGSSGLSGRRRSGHQVRYLPGKRRKRLRLSEIGKRRTPSCPDFPLQRPGQAPDLLRISGCYAGYRRRSGYRDQPGGSAH